MESLQHFWKSRIEELELSRDEYNKVGNNHKANEKHIELCAIGNCLRDLEELIRKQKAPKKPKVSLGWTNTWRKV